MGLTLDYNTNVPNGPNDPQDDQPEMLTNTQSINTWTNVDHVGYNVINAGIHKQVRMRNQGAPGLGDGQGVLYAGLINGNSWPIWQNSVGSFPLMSFPPQVAANGYTILAGGIVLEWGSITGANIANGQAVAFPLTFPTSVFSITIGPQSNSTNDKTISITTGSVTTSGFTVITSGSSLFQRLYWMAIGN